MKIIFIAGPYFEGGNYKKIEKNIRQAERFQIALANAGIGFFCPHNHTNHFEKKTRARESFYRKLDMIFLEKVADAMLAVPGWEKSKGAKAEAEWAKKHNLKIFFPKSPNDLGEILKWAGKIKKTPKKNKKRKEKIKKIKNKNKLKKIKKKSEKINEIKNKTPEEEKLKQLNEWFIKAKEEYPGKITNLEEFKSALNKGEFEDMGLIQEPPPKKDEKEKTAQPKPVQKKEKTELNKPTEPVKPKEEKPKEDKPREDKTMEKIRESLEKTSEGSGQNKSSESVFKKTIGLLNEGILEFKEEQQIKKIERLRIKCNYKKLVGEYESIINGILKEFDEKYPLSSGARNVINSVHKNKLPNLEGLTDQQKEEISIFIKERNNNLHQKTNSWFKQLKSKFNLTPEEFSLLAHLINKDFPYQ
jgi:hypothetical protein